MADMNMAQAGMGAAGGLAAFGLGAPAAAAPGGESGVFTQLLVGKAAPSVPNVAGEAAVQVPVPKVGAGVVQVPLLGADGQPLGVQVEGEVTEVTALSVRLEVIKQTLSQAGISMDDLMDAMSNGSGSEQLAAAFQAMGLSPEEAKAQAEKIEAALKMIKGKAELTSGQEGALAMLMMAAVPAPALAPPVAGNAETAAIQAFTVKVDITQVKISQMQAYATQKQGGEAGDPARLMLGLAAGEAATDGGPAKAPERPEVALTVTDEGFAVQDEAGDVLMSTLPDGVEGLFPTEGKGRVGGREAETGKAAPAGSTPVTQALTAAPVTAAVAAGDVLAKPQGEVMYQWKNEAGTAAKGEGDASEGKAERVEATPAARQAMDRLMDRPLTGTEGVGLAAREGLSGQAGSAGVFGGSSAFGQFADRLAYAMRHDAAGQVTVQMQQLADQIGGQGGGQVRMVLNPENLGEIRIDLTIKDGAVQGSISATDGAVVELLARDVHQLRNGLAEAGLKLGDGGINLMLSNSSHQGQQGQPGQSTGAQAMNGLLQGSGRGTDAGAVTAEAAMPDPTAWVSPERLVDVRI